MSRETYVEIINEIYKAVRIEDPSDIISKLPTKLNFEKQKRLRADIEKLEDQLCDRLKKIIETREFLRKSEEDIIKEEKELKRILSQRIYNKRVEYDRVRLLKQEYLNRIEKEYNNLDKELLERRQSFKAMNVEDMKKQFAKLFLDISNLLSKSQTTSQDLCPPQPQKKKEEVDSFDLNTFNNGTKGYGSFLSGHNSMFSSLNKTIMENVAKHGDILGQQDMITKRPPPMNLSSSGSKLFDEDPPLKKEETPPAHGKGKGPVMGAVAHKVPRKVPLNSSSGKKPIFSSSSEEDDDDDEEDDDDNNEKELVQQLKSILPNDALTFNASANDLFSDDDDDDDDDDDADEKMEMKDPFEKDKDEKTSEDPLETSSTSDSSKTSESSDYENEMDEFGNFDHSFPDGCAHPNPAHNETQRFIGITDPENKKIEDNVMEEIEKLKVDVDPKIKEKRKRKEEKRKKRKKEKRKVDTKSDEIATKKEEKEKEKEKKDKPKKSKPLSLKKPKSSGKKRGRPADYETEVDWDEPKIPKVRLTKYENELDEKEKGDYGHYKSIPEYETAIILSGLCKYCGNRYKQCECKCFMGHSRKECGAFPDRKCNKEMKQARHDGGFYVDATRIKVVNLIKNQTTDAILKKAHFKLARGYEIGYHVGKHHGWNLPSFMVQIIRWAIRHPDHDERCPVCMCKDMIRKSTYLVCYGCRNSGIIKPHFDTEWRDKAIEMEEKRKGGVKIKKRKRRQKKKDQPVTKKKKTKKE